MFSMTGLSPEQVAVLKDRFHVYLLPNGRLSVTGCKWLAMHSVAGTRFDSADN
jgi:aspartate aminotransferase